MPEVFVISNPISRIGMSSLPSASKVFYFDVKSSTMLFTFIHKAGDMKLRCQISLYYSFL